MSTVIGKIDISAFDGDGLEVVGTDEVDLLFGTDADDLFVAGDGNDVINAQRGDDSIVGGLGDDIIIGGFGDDIIEAGAGNDTIFGESDNDHINGDLGDDLIDGGEGADTLFGGAGSDTLFGGAGEDVFEFNLEDFAADEVDTIVDFNFAEDSLVINGFSDEDKISFDPTTNSISLNGENIINFGLANNLPESNAEDNDDGDYEII